MSSLFSTIFTVMNYNISEIWEIIKFGGPYIATLLALLILVEQITYLKRKWIAPGPTLVLPFVGNAIRLVRNPTKFWDDQADFAKSSHLGISANYIIGRFILFIRSSELSHKIFSNVRPDAFQLVGHPFGKKLFGEHNMIYMYGQEHKDLRRRIAPNFTPRALSTYCQIQQLVIAKHLNKWCEIGSDPVKLRLLARDMNLETSQNVFAGPYLSKEARERFKVDYNFFNVGVLALPIDLPGFAFRNARLAVDRLIETLTCCVEESREKMKRSGFGGESENESDDNEVVGNMPKCLVDYWMQDMIREEREKEKECGGGAYAPAPPPNCSNREIGGHVFDFLFAAQDASTSSLLWAVTLLDAHPDVLERVRVEVESVWELDSPITAEQLACMKYTHAVAREVVRFRAPATLVPHVACEDFPLTTDYVIPKGTIVFPSVYESSFQGFPEPHRFDPDRFYKEDRKEEQLYKRNFLVFGAGAHQCVGQRYALNLLVLFIAMFATLVDFKRHRSEGCDDIAFCPTICPKDDCLVSLSRRKSAKFPPFSLP